MAFAHQARAASRPWKASQALRWAPASSPSRHLSGLSPCSSAPHWYVQPCNPHSTPHPLQTLDEIQSYVLLRRWWTVQPNRQQLTAAPPDALSPTQLQELAVLLCRERTLLLNALESLLRLAHGTWTCLPALCVVGGASMRCLQVVMRYLPVRD